VDSKGKHPIGPKWQTRATTDPAKVDTWARAHPGCNWGVATGRESDLYVVDLDLGKDGAPLGEQTWVGLFGPIPDTHRVRTGSGAMQLYFRYPHRAHADGKPFPWRNTTKLIGDGIDTRGEGGQCVLPGSVSGKGPYELIADRPLLPMPDAVLDHIEAAERKAKGTPKQTTRERRAAATAITSAADFSAAGDGLHPYAAKAFADRIMEFRALVGAGNGRTYLLTGGALYLSRIANSTTPSGLTEKMIEDAYSEACQANGYAAEHPDWTTQLERGIRDGRTAGDPRTWPPADREDPNDQLIREVLASGDKDKLDQLAEAFGPGVVASYQARTRQHTEPKGKATSATITVADAALPGAVAAPDVPFDGPPASTLRRMVDVGKKDDTRDFSDVRKDVQRALGFSNAVKPWLYEHGEDMVLSGRGRLQVVNIDLLTSRLADRIAFVHRSHDANQLPIVKPSNPPDAVIRAIHADRANIGLPEVDRLAHTPFFGPDGTLQRTPGYHEKARTLYVPTPGIDIPDVPEHPTTQQVEDAATLILDDLLGDFPFTGPAELAGAVALGITPFVRSMIDGPTPLFAIDAPEPRTGKGLLMEMLLTPSSGRSYTVTPAPIEPREWPKAIVASLRSGPVAAIFDNAAARVESNALASAVTAYPAYTSRLLGLSETVHMPLPAVWVMTGNNIVCSAEIAGRVVRCRLDAGTQRPGERADFRHPELRRWATEHQGQIIGAFLTLIQSWIAAGQPVGEDLPTMGGFVEWVRIVGSILAFHGIGGLLTNRKALTDTMTDESADWNGLITMMAEMTADARAAGRKQLETGAAFEPGVPGDPAPERTGTSTTTGAAIADTRSEWSALELIGAMSAHSVVPPVDLGARTDMSPHYQARRLGKGLREHRDRRFGDHVLRFRTLHGSVVWRLDGI